MKFINNICVHLQRKRNNAMHSQTTQNDDGMNDPEAYAKNNDNQYEIAKHALEMYRNMFLSPENSIVIDIGCADGRVTELLHSKLPLTIEKLIAIDRSSEMTIYAANKYKLPKLEFKYFEWTLNDYTLLPKADHITSFNTFHWIPNMPLAFQQVYNLLNPNGDCLLTFAIKTDSSNILDDFKENNPKWAPYFNKPFMFQTQPYIEKILFDCKFSFFEVESHPQPFYFTDPTNLKGKFQFTFYFNLNFQ